MKYGNSSEYKSPSWSYGSSYWVTLVFTTITMLHTSVRRGRDRMVVLIVLHLYSLLLAYFILQSENYHTITTTTDWSMKYGNSSEYKCNTIRTTIRPTCIHYYYHASYFSPSWSWSHSSSYYVTLVFTTITILHTSVRRGGDCMVVLCDDDHDGLKYEVW
jgi:hypothetical protein